MEINIGKKINKKIKIKTSIITALVGQRLNEKLVLYPPTTTLRLKIIRKQKK